MSERVSEYCLKAFLDAEEAEKWGDTPSMDIPLAIALDLRDVRARVRELEAALSSLVEEVENDGDGLLLRGQDDAVLFDARAALARAKGEQP